MTAVEQSVLDWNSVYWLDLYVLALTLPTYSARWFGERGVYTHRHILTESKKTLISCLLSLPLGDACSIAVIFHMHVQSWSLSFIKRKMFTTYVV
jgi:hypothetical protein